MVLFFSTGYLNNQLDVLRNNREKCKFLISGDVDESAELRAVSFDKNDGCAFDAHTPSAFSLHQAKVI